MTASASWPCRNTDAESEVSFPGAGMYDHMPAIVDGITSRSGVSDPYTPYQPEVSQGGLQAMFEFQTGMSELTGLPVSNAALYEGPSAVASAAYLAIGATGREKLVASRGLHPHSRETMATYSAGFGSHVVEVPVAEGVTDATALGEAVDEDTAAIFIQQPNFLGAVEDVEVLAASAKEKGALVIVACDPIALSILKPPGECAPPTSPSGGSAARQPARLRRALVRVLLRDRGASAPDAGQDCRRSERRRRAARVRADAADARAAHPPREGDPQHLHRPSPERAGGDHPPELARQTWLRRVGRAARAPHRLHARDRLAVAVKGVELLHEAPAVREFAVGIETPAGASGVKEVLDRCAAEGVAAGYPLGRDYPEHENGSVAITERRSRADIDRLADVLGRAIGMGDAASRSPRARRREPGDRQRHAAPDLGRGGGRRCSATARARSSSARLRGAGRRRCPRPACPSRRSALIPKRLLRERPAEPPEVAEPEIVRHYTRISRRNFDLDRGFYPLGSCTMSTTRG